MRKSARLPVAISITISGKDAAGHPFKEATRTAEIDRQGARILTVHELALGAPVSIENPSLGQMALAKVVGHAEPRSRQEPFQVDVELVELPELFETASIWGIKSREPKPEQHLKKDSAPLEPAVSDAAGLRVAQATGPAEVDALVVSEPAGPVSDPASQVTGLNVSPVQTNDEALETSSSIAMDSAPPVIEETNARLPEVGPQLVPEAGVESLAAELRHRLAEAATSGAKEMECKSEALFRELQDRLENTLRDVEGKATKAVAGELEKVTAGFDALSVRHLEERSVWTVERLGEELKLLTAKAVGDADQRLASLSQPSADSLNRQTAAALEECRARAAEAVATQARSLEASAQAAAESVRRAAEEVLARIEKVREGLESAIGASGAGYEKRLSTMAGALDELEQRSKTLLADWPVGPEKFARGPAGLEGKEGAERTARQLEHAIAESRRVAEEVRCARLDSSRSSRMRCWRRWAAN